MSRWPSGTALKSPRVLAFYQRALLHRRHRPFHDLSSRSLWYLARLDGSEGGFRFAITLQQLRYDWDLLTEEAARDDDVLRLQLRVLDLAASSPEAERMIRPKLEEAPLGRLFTAMLAQARKESVREVALLFGVPPDGAVRVVHRSSEGEVEAMSIPATLQEDVRDFLRFVEAAGYERVRPYLHDGPGVPDGLGFDWFGRDRLTLTLR